MKIAVLNPGSMGISVAAALKSATHEVYWLNEKRSQATIDRAKNIGLSELTALEQLAEVDGIVSVCPPHAALAVATQVKTTGFKGLYLDANAISPETSAQVAQIIGTGFVDGGLIGPPVHKRGTTRLYLSGMDRMFVQNWFKGSVLDTVTMDDLSGSASALKMCYAAYTKGLSALTLVVRALAKEQRVEQTLLEEWHLSLPHLPDHCEKIVQGTASKAWRFSGEMKEIASTFSAASLPDGFHLAAAEVYDRMSGLKHETDVSLDRVLQEILT